MDVQSSATALSRRNRDLAAVFAQHPHRGFVQSREADVRDASAQERDAIALDTLGRLHASVVAKEERRLYRGRQAFHLPQSARQKAQGPNQTLQSSGLI